jgi:3-oxoacyl-[acyl-carrier-protein] synthase-3
LDRCIVPVGIVGVGSYVPPKVLTNLDLEKMVDTSDEWIVTRTGIRERRIADPETASSDLAVLAAQPALERAGVAPSDLDLIVVATVSPDMPYPATACLVQDRLGANHAAAFDLEAGCTGFIYALVMASQTVATGAYRNVLVIGTEVLSKFLDWTDRATCVLLGDGAGAAVLQPTDPGRGLLSFVLGSVGGAGDALKIPAGGSRLPASEETVRSRLHFTVMQGQEVFKFAVKAIEDACRVSVERAGLALDDVSLVIPHQANIRIIEAASKRLGISMDRFVSNVDRYGNTGAASTPIALDEALQNGRVHRGDVIVLVGFGAGLTWGAATLRW